MPDAQQIFNETVRHLPARERLRLATLILDQLTSATGSGAAELGDAWDEQDLKDLSQFSLKHADWAHQSEEDNGA